MVKLGHRVGASTIRQILKAPGAPCGAETAHLPEVAAVPAYASRDDARHRLLSRGLRGVPSALVLLLRDKGRPRYVHLLGVTTNPDGPWTTQQIRNLLMDPGGRAAGFWFLVRDRAGQFTVSFDAVLASAGIEAVKIPPRSPRANALAERFVLTARAEVIDRMLIVGERHLRTVLAGYEAHYNGRRPHRSCQLRPPRPDHPVADLSQQRIRRRAVLGGLINDTRGSPKSPAQDQRQSFGTPQAPRRRGDPPWPGWLDARAECLCRSACGKRVHAPGYEGVGSSAVRAGFTRRR